MRYVFTVFATLALTALVLSFAIRDQALTCPPAFNKVRMLEIVDELIDLHARQQAASAELIEAQEEYIKQLEQRAGLNRA